MRSLIAVVLLYGLVFGVTSFLLPVDHPVPFEEAGAAMGQAITQSLAPGVFGVVTAEAAIENCTNLERCRIVSSGTTYVAPGDTASYSFSCPAWSTGMEQSEVLTWPFYSLFTTVTTEMLPHGVAITVYNGNWWRIGSSIHLACGY